MNWYIEVLKKYAVFSGRARRKEYWFFCLFNIIISIALSIIDIFVLGADPVEGIGILSTIYTLGIVIPSLAVSVRRLHDTDRTGWWLLIAIIPLIGFIVLLVFMLLDSTPGENKYGSNPKEAPAPA